MSPLSLAALVLLPTRIFAESLTLTTWYPAPYGVYSQLRSAGSSYLAYQGGNVGIGTTGPSYKLDIIGAGGDLLHVRSNSGTNTSYGGIVIQGTGPSGLYMTYGDPSYASLPGYNVHADAATVAATGGKDLYLNAGAAETMVLKAYTGNVGIGTTDPQAKLQVLTTADETILSVRGLGRTPQIEIGRSGANDLYIGAAQGDNNLANHASAGDAVIGTRGGRLHLGVNNGNNAPIILEGASNTAYMQLGDAPSGQAMCYAGSPWPWFYRIGYCSSSRRNKSDILPLHLGLKTVAQLRPVTFRWKDQKERDLGFLAEEVEKVSPLLATYKPDGQILGVKYGQITAVLIKAMQEQQQELAAKDARINDLEKRIEALEASRKK